MPSSVPRFSSALSPSTVMVLSWLAHLRAHPQVVFLFAALLVALSFSFPPALMLARAVAVLGGFVRSVVTGEPAEEPWNFHALDARVVSAAHGVAVALALLGLAVGAFIFWVEVAAAVRVLDAAEAAAVAAAADPAAATAARAAAAAAESAAAAVAAEAAEDVALGRVIGLVERADAVYATTPVASVVFGGARLPPQHYLRVSSPFPSLKNLHQ